MELFTGIDIGSSATKIVIIDKEEKIVASSITLTGSRFDRNTSEALQKLMAENQITPEDVKYTIATGYGRKIFKQSDETVSEITANVAGGVAVGKNFGKVKTIINVGGQDSKIILLDDQGNVKNFIMNDKCAGGTGRFLELTAQNLEVDIDEMEKLHFQINGTPQPINSTCAVFAQSEIISLLANGHSKSEIAAGVHYAIAKRIARLSGRVSVEDIVLFDGGTALNRGMVAALEDELMRKIIVPENPQIITAFGAALIAKNEMAKIIN